MKEVKFEQFLIVERHVWEDMECDKSDSILEYTTDSLTMLPMGTVVPIIVKGQKCVGYAAIQLLSLRLDGTTTIKFKFISVPESTRRGLFDFYTSTTANKRKTRDDMYDTDDYVPGLYQRRQ